MTFGGWYDFEIPLENDEVAWIKDRVRTYRWFEEPIDAGWQYGANQAYLKRLQRYWLDQYSWRRAVTQINTLPHFKVDVGDGLHLHCIHRRAANPSAPTLLLCHGWPGSILEFTHLIEQLAEPDDPAQQAFHIIAPSLPGYGWSDAPPQPIGPRGVAKYYDRLMQSLGYERYIAQGGDWGSLISAWLALDSSRCDAIHLSGYGLRAHDMRPSTDEDAAWLKRAAKLRARETGYMAIQSTKPQSLSYAMMESPMGVAAWIIEKFQSAGDRAAPGVLSDEREETDPVFSMDWLLTNVMIYLTTRSFNTAAWLYAGMAQEGGFSMPEGMFVDKPTGVANFPKDMLAFPPRAMVERSYNVCHWSEMLHGGHFPSVEVPDVFAEDIRRFVRSLGART